MRQPIRVDCFYRRPEAAAALGVSLSTLDVLLGTGQLKPERRGRRVEISGAELDRFDRRRNPERPLWPAKVKGRTVRGYRHGAPRLARIHEIDLQLV